MNPDHSLAAPEVCPACGAPYPLGGKGGGCPVCLMRGALGSEPASGGMPLDQALARPVAGHFDHYALVQRADGAFEELGRGAMGITYRAVDTVLGHAVALKVLDARIATHPQARERFLREARAAARLRHPHVASVFYYGVRPGDGQCFYAMELVEGESLAARVRREGPLPVALALEVTTQVARALAAASTQGVVHRDLKPANLMLANGPELMVKVIDFGLAKAVADAASEADLTQGGFVGTPAFASPEQCAGEDVDVRSDLYSLGVTLWMALTGQTPFRGSPAQVRQRHRSTPLPLEQLEGVPQPVATLLETLLAEEPAQRFQTPAQLLQALPKVTAAIQAARPPSRRALQKGPWAAAATGTRKPQARLVPKQISIARLPVTGSDIFGREEDVAFLDRAWANKGVNVVTIVAWAGVGKSTLVNHWLRRMARDHYRSAELVFGWSFYRQGTGGGTSSADEFFDAALHWFGDPDPRLGTAWEKGERLAKLVARRRTLLILDGLEPLQNPPGPQEGRLREPSIQALLRELAAFNTGLCVITTRTPIADIADYERSSALRRDLDQLSRDAGAKLLRALGVNGDETELRTASDEFTGHCLALTLLGSYLADAYNGDIRRREEVSARLAHDLRQGAHARKVMESYQIWLGEGPEVAVLRMLGLFDRPADEQAIAALLKTPAIPGLTEPLADLRPTEWQTILAKLRRARLLAREDPHNPGQLDTHPLVREYFGEQLRSQQTEAWKECNRRLYHYYRTLAPQLPDNFREMEPLFSSVICGCNAGLYHEALHEVYIPRIQRGDAHFAANVLGARSALLSVLVHFFERGHWGSPAETAAAGQSLTAEDQLFILMQAGMYLTATRGFGAPEAKICYDRAERLCHSLNRPLLLYVTLAGHWRFSLHAEKLTATMRIAERVCTLAEEQNNPALKVGAYQFLAATLYNLGDFQAARKYARSGIQIWRSGAVLSPVDDFENGVVCCLGYDGILDWHFGEMDSCQATMAEAIALAKEVNDMHGLATILCYAALLGYCKRNPAEAERLASDFIELSTRHHFAHWLVWGSIYRGWARSASGDTKEGISLIEDGIRDYRATGAIISLPLALGMKAEALHLADRTSEALEAIKEAQAIAARSGEGYSCAELHRLRGVFLAAFGAEETQIEAAFQAAISIAREQKSISLAKRAEATYAEYRRQKASGSAGRRFRLPLC